MHYKRLSKYALSSPIKSSSTDKVTKLKRKRIQSETEQSGSEDNQDHSGFEIDNVSS